MDKRIPLYTSQRYIFERMNNTQRGRLVLALFDYADGKRTDFSADNILQFAYDVLCAKMDEEESKRADIAEKRAAAGRKHQGNQHTAKSTPQLEQMEQMEQMFQIGTNGTNGTNVPTKGHEVSDADETLYQGFCKWLSENCPYIYGNIQMLSAWEFTKLKQQYSSEDIASVCLNIENRKDLRKRYTNMYRTLLNWLKRNGEQQGQKQATAAKNRALGAADVVRNLLSADETAEGYTDID